MRKIFHRMFGFPIWTQDFDGEIRKRRAKYLPDGRIITTKIWGYAIGNADGTFDRGYVKRWFHRETTIGWITNDHTT